MQGDMAEISLIAAVASALAAIFIPLLIHKWQLPPKPAVWLEEGLNQIAIKNVSGKPILIAEIKGRHGSVADCSWQALGFGKPGREPDWQRKHAIHLEIGPGETEYVCWFDRGRSFKVSVKRVGMGKSNQFVIILSPQ